MKIVRLLVLAAVLPVALISCTQPPRRCSSATCSTGCCDSNGECQSGSAITACGTSGNDCRTCGTGQTCSAGACMTTTTAGGSAGGGVAGGGVGGGSSDGGATGGGSAGGMPNCATGLTYCGTSCVNTRTEYAHCGGCGNSCGAGQYCDNNQCVNVPATCTPGPGACPSGFYCDAVQQKCIFGCQASSDCGGGQICDVPNARCNCPMGTNLCGGSCLPTNTPTACGAQCLNCSVGANSIPLCNAGVCDFTCAAGFHKCGNQCISNFDVMACGQRCTPCSVPPNGMATCDGTDCGSTCAQGFHQCGADCVSNFDVATCGNSCSPCMAPANGIAQCMSVGGGAPACTFTCNPGFNRCGNQCLPDSATSCGATCQTCTPPAGATNPQCVAGQCQYTCATGFHQCGTQCVSDMALTSCGTSCTSCPVPIGGSATCDGTSCGIQCNPGSHPCNGQCVSNFATATCGTRCTPCPDGPMGSGTTTTCDGVACGLRCSSMSTPNYCGNMCVADSLTTCGPSCSTCTAPGNGTPICQNGICDFNCAAGFHRCGTACVPDNSVDACGTSCAACPSGPPNSVRTCTQPTTLAPYACGWNCAVGSNRCPVGGQTCVPADYVLACGPTCAVCSSANPNERGVCGSNGICSTGCVTQCGGTCVNTQTNASHCGACNTACGGADRCTQGECRSSCATGVAFRTMLPAITAETSANFPMLVVDVNGDGRPDLVSAESFTLYVRYGQASGGFASTASAITNLSFAPTYLVAGELTGDSRPEIVGIGSGSSALVLRNSGTGTFSQYTVTANPTTFQTPSTVTIGEFTGAAPADVLFGFNTSTASQAAILFPSITSTGLPLGAGVSANIGISLVTNLRAASVNADANSDLVATAATNAVYLFGGTGMAATPFNTSGAALAQLPGGETFTLSSGTPFPLEVLDVTGDGIPDVVVPSTTAGGAHQARVFPMTTGLTIGTSVALSVPAAVRVISLADVSGDGRNDVGVGSTDLRIFPSQAGGTFGSAQVVGVSITSTLLQPLVLADITADTRPDLTLQSGSSIVTVPNEAGAFPSLQGASVPTGERLVTGDLNGDGLGDVVVTPTPAAVMNANVFFGGATGFTAGPTIAVRGDRAAIGRLNGDTAFDLVTIGNAPDASIPDAGGIVGNPNFRLGDATNPTSTTIRGRLEVFRNGQWGTVCDDGWSVDESQIACRSLGYTTAGALFFSASGGMDPIQMDDVQCLGTESDLLSCTFTTFHNCIHSEDVGVECSTIGAVPAIPSVIEVRFGSTSGTLSAPQLLTTPTSPTLVEITDVNGDGNGDIIASTSSTLQWFRNLDGGSFAPAEQIAPNGFASIAVVDVNNDGRRDLLALSSSFSTVTPFINVVAGFVPVSPVTVSALTGTNVVAADLNNDSKPDFVVGDSVFRGDGSGGFVFLDTLPVVPPRLVLTDLDNDGLLDLACSGGGSSVLSVVRGAVGTPFFQTTALNFSGGAPVADVAPIRLNTDAQRDLIALVGAPGARFLAPLPGVCR